MEFFSSNQYFLSLKSKTVAPYSLLFYPSCFQFTNIIFILYLFFCRFYSVFQCMFSCFAYLKFQFYLQESSYFLWCMQNPALPGIPSVSKWSPPFENHVSDRPFVYPLLILFSLTWSNRQNKLSSVFINKMLLFTDSIPISCIAKRVTENAD